MAGSPVFEATDSSLKNGVFFREHRLFALELVAQKVWYTATLSIEMSSTVSAAGTSGGGNGAISARQLLGAGLRPAKSQLLIQNNAHTYIKYSIPHFIEECTIVW